MKTHLGQESNPETLSLIANDLPIELSGRHRIKHNHSDNHLVMTHGLLFETARQKIPKQKQLDRML